MTKTDLKKVLEKTSDLVNPKIVELLTNNIEKENKKATIYQCTVGGKRIRPALAITTCQLLGGKIQDAIYPAASLEILHNYTLIVDDIIDHSDTRRDKETVWKKFGKTMAECFSMYYAASIFEGAVRTKNSSDLVKIFTETLKKIIDGEIKDILFECTGRDDEKYIIKNRFKKITLEDYFGMVSKKTAALLKASCEVGAVCADAKKRERELLSDYGRNIGMAFQIQDDTLDIFGDERTFGKKIGKDIIEKKMGNIIVLLALNELRGEERQKIYSILHKSEEVTDNDIKKVVSLINKTSAKEKAGRFAEKYIEKAQKSLKQLPKNEYQEILSDIADYIIKREK